MKTRQLQESRTNRLAAGELRHIVLNGSEVAYTLMRCRRKTIGMRIGSEGLAVRIPSREPLNRVEAVLQKKAAWIVLKLDEWKNRKPTGPVWCEGAVLPLLGEPWRITISPAGGVQMIPVQDNTPVASGQLSLSLSLPSAITAGEIETAVMAWYRAEAMTCFQERIALYARRLGVTLPQLRLSRARTLWGSCNSRGLIHLNWRLIQKPLDLVDYVVAHELSHLIEMNHSKAFWRIVESIYPNCTAARKRLRNIG